jgi:DNA-3-methyladenine glycosylase I
LGKPLHDDRRLFEMLILEGKSCGLSWGLILKKCDHMRKVFADFDPNATIKCKNVKIEELMQDAGIIPDSVINCSPPKREDAAVLRA